MFLESIESEQHYVEDCEVCCRPFDLVVVARDGELASLEVRE